MSTEKLALIPLLPLLAAVLTCGMRCGRRAAAVAIGAMSLSLAIALVMLANAWAHGGVQTVSLADWLVVGAAKIQFSLLLDPLSACMAAMVTFVGLLIFIYSSGYMKDDPRCARFFCYLSLFAAGMLGLVLANNLLLLFMSWEIVGVASYLLIGFWFHKPAAAAAGKKAFIVTRIGDMGFLIGILLAFTQAGTLELFDNGNGLLEKIPTGVVWGIGAAKLISLFLFCGAIGKSGQLPLHVWLPDAMEGPTPVSALIHAATMVAAGVFLVARTFPLFVEGQTLPLVAWVGGLTAFVAALIALGQYDIKRILAYSTVSQLGLMMVGLGTAATGAVGMFHLFTHAFFKALLFLGAGSIIHGCHEEQDIRRMGGIARAMPITTAAYLCGALALVAFPFTSGYFSKDAVLISAYGADRNLFYLCALTSLITALYVTRQCVYVFIGTHRGAQAPHESPPVLTAPLVILAAFALGLGGLAGNSLLAKLGAKHSEHPFAVIATSWAVALGGMLLGWVIYARRDLGRTTDPLALSALANKFYFDELYAATVGRLWTALTWLVVMLQELLAGVCELGVQLTQAAGQFFARSVDVRLIDELTMDGLARRFHKGGEVATGFQTGLLSGYLRWIALGALAVGVFVHWLWK